MTAALVQPDLSCIRAGSYLLGYTAVYRPLGGIDHSSFVGTLRVAEEEGEAVRLSGDLYRTGEVWPLDPSNPDPILVAMPTPASGLPIFPLRAYDSHLRVVRAEACANGDGLLLWFERYAYDADRSAFNYAGSFKTRLERKPPNGDYPSPEDFWVGQVRDAASQVVGVVTLGWVSPFLRKATLEIDFEEGAVVPLDNGRGIDWDFIFRRIGWEMLLRRTETPVPLPSSGAWTGETLHETMLTFRDFQDLDGEWLYHMLCVKKLEFPSDPGGAMYDRANFDSNGIPREGFAVASDFVYPSETKFGRAAGQRAGDVPELLFRTAAHELGHALGLSHAVGPSGSGRSFMSPTDSVAEAGTVGNPFPDNVIFAFSDSDRLRLQHAPDILIRPGGPFRGGQFSYGMDPAAPVATRLSSL